MEEFKNQPSPLAVEQGDDSNEMSTGTKVGIGVGILVGAVLLILALIFLLNNPGTTETIRDIFIIVLALETVIIATLIVILIYQLIALIRMVRDDLKPLVESTQETLNAVQGTATFVSQRVTKPAIETSSYITGIGRSIRVLFRMVPRRGQSTNKEGE